MKYARDSNLMNIHIYSFLQKCYDRDDQEFSMASKKEKSRKKTPL